MSTINIVNIETPYAAMDDVIAIYLDAENDGYKLSELINFTGAYTFSIWHKSEAESIIVFNLFGQEVEVQSNTSWQKYKTTIEVADLSNVDISISPALNVMSYFYEAYLVEGTLDLSWTPAPEDLENKFASIKIETDKIVSTVFDSETGESKIEQTATAIRQEISSLKEEISGVAVRYIRDWVFGNDFDDSSSWVSCQVYVDGKNIAQGKQATLIWEPEVAYDENNNPIEIEQVEPIISDFRLYTDGKLISYTDTSVSDDGSIDEGTIVDPTSYITTTFTGKACLEIDLGKIQTDIDYIAVWHDYSEAKSYNHYLEVSEDGENWIELFNSVNGTYVETSDGKTYNFAKQLVAAQTSTILQTLDNILLQVNGLNEQMSQLKIESGEISATVANNQKTYDSFVNGAYKDLTEKITSESFAQSVVDLSGIKDIVIGEIDDMGFASKTDIEQNSELWKLTFSKIGVDTDKVIENEEVAISMDSTGIKVTGETEEDSGEIHTRETRLNTDGLEGWYDTTKVFWIEKDSVKTERVHCNRGIDTDAIKIIPMDNYIVNSTKYGVLAFVKSGGSS